MDSKSLFLTANTETVYSLMWLDLRDGPLVIETLPNILGLIDDFWFHYVGDLGNARIAAWLVALEQGRPTSDRLVVTDSLYSRMADRIAIAVSAPRRADRRLRSKGRRVGLAASSDTLPHESWFRVSITAAINHASAAQTHGCAEEKQKLRQNVLDGADCQGVRQAPRI